MPRSSTRRVWRAPVAVVGAIVSAAVLIAGSAVAPAAAQAPAKSLQVQIEAVGPTGVAGLALITPAASGGTDIQVLTAGAPAQTFAVIHPGTCAVIDPTPVALLGDVGAGANIQVSVPNPFETIADGAHVLALHAGLDMTAATGCGAIPAGTLVPIRPESPAPQPAGTGGSYTGPTVGFVLTWDGGWTEYPIEGLPGAEQVGLSNGVSSVAISGVIDPAPDAQDCVRAAEDFLLEQLRNGDIGGLEPLEDATGAPVTGGDAARAWVGYRYRATDSKGNGSDVAEYHECRTAGTVQVRIQHRAPAAFYPAQAAAREALLAGLTLPETPPAPTPAPVDRACVGLEAWVDATNARLDRITEIRTEANDLLDRLDIDGYKALLPRFGSEVRRMLADQQGGSTPGAAAAANELALTAYGHFIEAADLLVQYYSIGASQPRYTQAIGAIKDGDTAVADLRAAIVVAQTTCG